MTAADLLVAAGVNLLWGFNIVAVKLSLAGAGPFTAGVLRQLILFAACGTALRLVPSRMRELLAFSVMFGGLFILLVNLSLVHADNVGALAIAGQLGVPMALALAWAVLGERVSRLKLAGMLLAFGGVGVLLFDPHILDERVGLLLPVAASAIWAAGSLIQRRLKDVPLRTIYAWLGLVGAALLVPFAWVWEWRAGAAAPGFASVGWIAYSALGSTLGGHGGMTWLLQRHSIGTVVPLTLGAPVVGVAVSALWFGTPVTAAMVAGGLVALAGVGLIGVAGARDGQGGTDAR